MSLIATPNYKPTSRCTRPPARPTVIVPKRRKRQRRGAGGGNKGRKKARTDEPQFTAVALLESTTWRYEWWMSQKFVQQNVSLMYSLLKSDFNVSHRHAVRHAQEVPEQHVLSQSLTHTVDVLRNIQSAFCSDVPYYARRSNSGPTFCASKVIAPTSALKYNLEEHVNIIAIS